MHRHRPNPAESPASSARAVEVALALLLAAALSGAPAAAGAEETPESGDPSVAEPGDAPSAESDVPANAELDPDTPRGAVAAYLEAGRQGDWEEAARFLNLSPVPRNERASQGPVLARQLKTVLDRELWVELELLSRRPEGDPDDGLPRGRDRVGVIRTASGEVSVLVERVAGETGPEWKIAAATVARIPELYEEFGDGLLGRVLPPVFFDSQLFGVQLWQWIGLLGLVFVAWLASWAFVRVLVGLVRPLVARSKTEIDDHLFAAVLGPARLIAALGFFRLGLVPLALSLPAQRFLVGAEKVLAIVAVAWFLLRLIDLLSQMAASRLEARDQTEVVRFMPLGRKTVKVVVVGLAVLAGLDSFGFDVTALIAGLGIGGLAVALALQKTLENLFGGATLIADRPVQVGDFCRFGDKVGTVEEIGLRSTRVRTLDRTLVSVPNADFSTLQLENFAKRDRIWYHPTLGLRYETTPDQLRYVLVEIRKMLYAHPKVDPDPARVRFTGFGACSLDLAIFAYVRVTDYAEFLEVAEDLNLRIMDIVEAAGSGFAFPSSTTYVAKDDGLDAERVREAEATVRDWREKGELCLPGFPPEKREALRETLAYPPEGSALR